MIAFSRLALISLVIAFAAYPLTTNAANTGEAVQCLPGLPCVVNSGSGQNADKSENPSCDADFMNQIYARASLEAEREIVLAGVSIRKPDSVLEYTCFDKSGYQAYTSATALFSAASGRPNGYESMTLPGVNSYIQANFPHKFLGRLNAPDYELGQHTSGGCSVMNAVHALAKCIDFGEDYHQFFTLEELATGDPRILPPGYECARNAITPQLINLANNAEGVFVKNDTIESYTTPDECRAPIDTGLTFERVKAVTDNRGRTNIIEDDKGPGNHKVCANPVCYYNTDEDSCVKK